MGESRHLRPDVAAWLGDFAGEVSEEQGDTLAEVFDLVEARWPDPDQADVRRGVLTGAAQIVLGDDTLEGLGEAAQRARLAEQEARDLLTGALLVSAGTGVSEVELARRASTTRMTVRKALGKSAGARPK